jgi:hypothetical protein
MARSGLQFTGSLELHPKCSYIDSWPRTRHMGWRLISGSGPSTGTIRYPHPFNRSR